jgi:hypothetical protein
MEPCVHEQDFGKMVANMEHLIKDFYGNGKPGIAIMIPEIKNQIDELKKSSEATNSSLSELVESYYKMMAIDDYKEKEKLNSQQRRDVIISAIIGISGVIATLIVTIL